MQTNPKLKYVIFLIRDLFKILQFLINLMIIEKLVKFQYNYFGLEKIENSIDNKDMVILRAEYNRYYVNYIRTVY